MEFYKLYCLVYRRTDYFQLDRMRRKLMYPEYYAEQEKKAKDKMMELVFANSFLTNTLNHDRW